MTDARFEDGAERPLRLAAQDAADLRVIAALVQDAVLTAADMTWQPRQRRFALLINRFRWEDRAAAQAARRPVERVRSVLTFGDVTRVAQQGLDRRDRDTVLSLLTLDYAPDAPPEDLDADLDAPAGPGRVTLVLAGDGAVALTVECLDVTLSDVTRPYAAPARRAPHHDI
jgi:hypothetical protein